MFFYFDRIIDTDLALETMKQKSRMGNDALVLHEISTQDRTIETPEGTIKYTLHQYDLQGEYSSGIQRGITLAYVPLTKGYLDIRG